jgi:hypothetical protein
MNDIIIILLLLVIVWLLLYHKTNSKVIIDQRQIYASNDELEQYVEKLEVFLHYILSRNKDEYNVYREALDYIQRRRGVILAKEKKQALSVLIKQHKEMLAKKGN